MWIELLLICKKIYILMLKYMQKIFINKFCCDIFEKLLNFGGEYNGE